MSSRFRLLSLGLAVVMLAGSVVSCDLFTGGGEDTLENSFPEGAVLVASMDGNEPALWLFDPETLERIDVIETGNRVPKGIAFSPEYERWYLTWSLGSYLADSAKNVLAMFDSQNRQFMKRRTFSDLSVGGTPLLYEPTADHVVGYGNKNAETGLNVQFFDPKTLGMVDETSIGSGDNRVGAAVVAGDRRKLYFGELTTNWNHVHVYDVAEREITDHIRLTDDPTLKQSAVSDLALSPDQRYLYATTFLSPSGPGRFFVLDLDTGEVIFEGPAGGYSNIAVHPNGRYVYIDCPAGGPRNLIPMQKVFRFDLRAREMETFIDGEEGLGLEDGTLVTDEITMLPGGEILAMIIKGGVENSEGTNVHLALVDTETGQALTTYSLPRDERGYITFLFRSLEYGVVP